MGLRKSSGVTLETRLGPHLLEMPEVRVLRLVHPPVGETWRCYQVPARASEQLLEAALSPVLPGHPAASGEAELSLALRPPAGHFRRAPLELELQPYACPT